MTEAKRFSIDIPDSEVDSSYAGVATRMGIDTQKLTQLLVAGGASDDTLKRRLRAQLAWTNLVRGRYKASLEIRDKDVEAQLLQKPEKEKNDVGYEYIMRPVVFIVPRGSPETAHVAIQCKEELHKTLRGKTAQFVVEKSRHLRLGKAQPPGNRGLAQPLLLNHSN